MMQIMPASFHRNGLRASTKLDRKSGAIADKAGGVNAAPKRDVYAHAVHKLLPLITPMNDNRKNISPAEKQTYSAHTGKPPEPSVKIYNIE